MTTRPDGNPSPPRLPLPVLSRSVRNARAAVHQYRHGRVVPAELANARHELIVALEAYTSALEERRLPVPHALHTELLMHRRLFDR